MAYQEVSPLLAISKKGYKQKYDFVIDCTDLQDYNFVDIRQSIEFENLLIQLKSITGPVLYVFEIISNTYSTDIIEKIKDYSKKDKPKTTPFIKMNYSKTNFLYVGKVKRNFGGRIIQHLGFYKTPKTKGLQLYCWAKPLKLQLRLHAFEFNDEANEMISILEKGLSLKLKPILGKQLFNK